MYEENQNEIDIRENKDYDVFLIVFIRVGKDILYPR